MDNLGATGSNRRGWGFIAAGLLMMLVAVVIALLAIGSGSSVSPYAGGTVLVGFVLLVVGLRRRALGIMDSR
ncbi:hypothetical protein ACIQXM_01920 [Arthrobacter sp. NPDC097144]|uniref:hypothetical protein n=1 Tax=Arthrobacter sp. NPDC097144 TaxID=3363946 RepID=UPI0038174B85